MNKDIIFRKATFGGFNRDDVMAYINNAKEEEISLRTSLSDTEKENAQLKSELESVRSELQCVISEKDDEINDVREKYESEIQAMQADFEERLQNNAIAERSVEEQVGSAMIDVRRYADLLIQETCTKIEQMSDASDTAVAKTLARVLDISSGIQVFSDNLNNVLRDILAENEELCKELTGFKGSLKLPFDVAAEKVQTDILDE